MIANGQCDASCWKNFFKYPPYRDSSPCKGDRGAALMVKERGRCIVYKPIGHIWPLIIWVQIHSSWSVQWMHSEPVQLLPGPSRIHQGGHAAGLDKGEGPRGQRQQGMSQDDRSRWVVGTNSVVMGVNHFMLNSSLQLWEKEWLQVFWLLHKLQMFTGGR